MEKEGANVKEEEDEKYATSVEFWFAESPLPGPSAPAATAADALAL